jgi:small subunit ribosomal protein S1
MVVKTNKGGLEVTVGSLRGFLPASQVDLGFVSNLETYVGQKLGVQVTEVNPKKRKLIVSRRAVLELERKDLEAELWTKLAVGQTRSGKVKTIKDYGAFVDIGGVDGFLHIGEISHSRIRHPSDVLKEGQDVEVQILKLEPEKKKISLGMRQLIQDPWKTVTSNYPADSTVTGKVTRVADFGAFVELELGVEGLVHVSEIAHQRVNRVADVLKEGQEVQAKVLEVDPDRKRIGLSLKALLPRPVDKSRPAVEDRPVEPYHRQRSGPLKGGTSDAVSKPGGLFGNPNDFGR